jgi:hypothetical protein
MHTYIFVGKIEGKYLLGDLGVDGGLLLYWIVKKCFERLYWIQLAGFCEHDNEPSASIKGGNFLNG